MKRFKAALMGLLMFAVLLSGYTPVFAEEVGTWTFKSPIPRAMKNFATTVVNGKIYVIGGQISTGVATTIVEEYDPTTDHWTTKASMPTPRYLHATASVNGKIYAIGGYDAPGKQLNSVEEYDPISDTWTTKAPMPTIRSQLSAVGVNGKIYAIGGYQYSTSKDIYDVEEYDPNTNTWTSKSSIPTDRSITAVEINGEIFTIGGKVQKYDPITDTWTFLKSSTGLYPYSKSAAVNGKLYYIGGNNHLSNVDEYDPATNTWTPQPNLQVGRSYHGVVALNNKIYAIGGLDQASTFTTTVEVFSIAPEVTPIDLTGTAGNAQITLNWNNINNATNYKVKRALTAGGPYETISTVSENSYTDTAVTNGTTYYYAVSAIVNGIESANSNEVSLTPHADIVLPDPVILTGTAGNAQTNLTWDPSNNATGYNIKRATTPGGPYTTIDTVTTTNYTDNPVTNGTTYYYVVSAINTDGESSNSNEVALTPQGSTGPVDPVDPTPGNKALLVLTMTNGERKEFDLTKAQVNAFIAWYEDQYDRNGNRAYAFVKDYNKGPFKARTEYVAFRQIQSFEVNEY